MSTHYYFLDMNMEFRGQHSTSYSVPPIKVNEMGVPHANWHWKGVTWVLRSGIELRMESAEDIAIWGMTQTHKETDKADTHRSQEINLVGPCAGLVMVPGCPVTAQSSIEDHGCTHVQIATESCMVS